MRRYVWRMSGIQKRQRQQPTLKRTFASRAKPMDNTDMDLYWRKEVAADFAGYALKELRGDDMRQTRLRIARFEL